MKTLRNLFLLLSISWLTLSSSLVFAQYHGGESITFEGFALGQDFNLPACAPSEETTTTSCQTALDEETFQQHTIQNYRVQLGTQLSDHLSSIKYISVSTLDGKVARVTIITAGLSQQERIFATLQERLDDPDDYFVISEQNTDTFPHYALGSIAAIWVTRDGQISFSGEIKPQGYGIITMHAKELLVK